MRQHLERVAAKMDHQEVVRYVINGVVATLLHYTVLTINLRLLEIPSAGAANLIAAVFGISASYLGSRYYVFRQQHRAMFVQASRFLLLYGVIACLHGLVLLVWSDWYGFSYHSGFLLATALQVSLSYVGNKFLVFT